MRVMVIDDSRTTRIIIGQILRELGMDMLEAAHGLDALEKLKLDPKVDLILVDWNMPVMNGLEFIRALRSQPAFEAVRILMVTSEAQGDHVAQALEAGANEYLMKPFNKEVLMTKLDLLDALPE